MSANSGFERTGSIVHSLLYGGPRHSKWDNPELNEDESYRQNDDDPTMLAEAEAFSNPPVRKSPIPPQKSDDDIDKLEDINYRIMLRDAARKYLFEGGDPKLLGEHLAHRWLGAIDPETCHRYAATKTEDFGKLAMARYVARQARQAEDDAQDLQRRHIRYSLDPKRQLTLHETQKIAETAPPTATIVQMQVQSQFHKFSEAELPAAVDLMDYDTLTNRHPELVPELAEEIFRRGGNEADVLAEACRRWPSVSATALRTYVRMTCMPLRWKAEQASIATVPACEPVTVSAVETAPVTEAVTEVDEAPAPKAARKRISNPIRKSDAKKFEKVKSAVESCGGTVDDIAFINASLDKHESAYVATGHLKALHPEMDVATCRALVMSVCAKRSAARLAARKQETDEEYAERNRDTHRRYGTHFEYNGIEYQIKNDTVHRQREKDLNRYVRVPLTLVGVPQAFKPRPNSADPLNFTLKNIDKSFPVITCAYGMASKHLSKMVALFIVWQQQDCGYITINGVDHIVIETTANELRKAEGLTSYGGSAQEATKRTLNDLTHTAVDMLVDGKMIRVPLIKSLVIEEGGKILVVLCAELSRVHDKKAMKSIDRAEFVALRRDGAKFLTYLHIDYATSHRGSGAILLSTLATRQASKPLTRAQLAKLAEKVLTLNGSHLSDERTVTVTAVPARDRRKGLVIRFKAIKQAA